jgi:hypothetical protein
MDPTRFDKFLEGIRGYLGQRDRIRTRLLSADPIIESVETLQNVVRNRTVESATALLRDAYGFPPADASALAGLLVSSQGQNIFLLKVIFLFCFFFFFRSTTSTSSTRFR